MSKTSNEADVIFNRANVALARSQRLIQSWLPQRSNDDIANAKTEEQLQREDEELFKPAPERLGVGAMAPESELDGSFKRRALSSNDKLLDQLLGKKGAKVHRASKALPGKGQAEQQGPSAQTTSMSGHGEDSDDEEGRAGMFQSKSAAKRKRKAPLEDMSIPPNTQVPSVSGEVEVGESPGGFKSHPGRSKTDIYSSSSEDEQVAKPSKKKASSYLDEILAEKARKKKKKGI